MFDFADFLLLALFLLLADLLLFFFFFFFAAPGDVLALVVNDAAWAFLTKGVPRGSKVRFSCSVGISALD